MFDSFFRPQNMMTDSEKRANETIEEISRLLHPNAKKELQDNIELARYWLSLRFAGLPGFTPETQISLALNEYNKINGLGLQSVSVLSKNDEELLFDSEWKSPTIGVIASGMIDGNVEFAEADFDIEDGKAEGICSLNKEPFHMTRISKTHRGIVDNKEILGPCEAMLAMGNYFAIRTILEMKDAPREKVRDIINHGVYGCQFVKTFKRRDP